MEDETNAAGASGGEQTVATSPVPQVKENLSESEAESVFSDIFGDEGDEPEAAEDEPSQEASADTEGEEASGDTDEPGDEPETEDEGEAAEGFAHGNTKVRLRDGTVTTVATLKKSSTDLIRDIERFRGENATIKEEHSKVKTELDTLKAQPAQWDQTSRAILDEATQVLYSRIPPPPDESLLDERSPNYDPAEYSAQEGRRQIAANKWRRMAQNRQNVINKEAADAQASQVDWLNKQREAISKDLGISDRKQADAFLSELAPALAKFGFSEEDIARSPDARFWKWGKRYLEGEKAIAELAKAKEAAAKKTTQPAQTTPVAKPGARSTTSERRIQNVKELAQRTRQPLTEDQGADILSHLF